MLFDKEDLDILENINIYAQKSISSDTEHWTANTSSNKKSKMIYIHRLIYEKHNGKISDNLVIDHIDNSFYKGLDNRK